MTDQLPSELFDPEITDEYVREQVGRHRWYWLLLLKDGPVEDFADDEAALIQAAHLRHMFTLRKRGQLTMFGPVRQSAPLRGIGVLTVETLEEAERLMVDDPWIRAGGLAAEIRPFFSQPAATLPD